MRKKKVETHISVKRRTVLHQWTAIYSEISQAIPNPMGSLMNARFIQGIFDDKADPRDFLLWLGQMGSEGTPKA